ncbi:50S ribosomal protein L6 [Candidatus Pacearchaeota archaeon]|jgi:large subunit ribosomal protein L6|nr:50S ribosomal protein L6 [Candidatus Pacearchaeota archaeon]|tara:strand:+ start:29738 stop:30280 length:543 start_codon:yes stop_codon:yes gene_type:complete
MKKKLERTVDLPEGFTSEIKGNTIKLKGNSKETERDFDLGKVLVKQEGNKITISCEKATRREAATIGTTQAHLQNMIRGLSEGFTYKLEICNVHFPMNVKAEGNKVTIKSYLGEKKDREAKIEDGSKVEIKGTEITVTSDDIEKAGQTAANLEKATKLKGRDRRIFQDGIFITEKNGRKI